MSAPDDDTPTGHSPTELGEAIEETEAHTAWALDDGEDYPTDARCLSARQITTIAVVASLTVVVAVAAFAGYTMGSQPQRSPPTGNGPTPNPATGPSAASPPLDGLYRLDYDLAKRTQTGTAAPLEAEDTASYWAIRSTCTQQGCAATAVGLESGEQLTPRTPPTAANLQFIDGAWRETPYVKQVDQRACLDSNDDVGPGSHTESVAWTLKPESGAALRGAQVTTVLTNECGHAGAVVEIPISVTRIGDISPGIEIPDPKPTPPPPPDRGTVVTEGVKLDGLYRVDIESSQQTANGVHVGAALTNRSELWAFRSACTATACAATAAQVLDGNTQQNTRVTGVLHLTGGQWQGSPSLQPPAECAGGSAGSEVMALHWSLTKQPDNSLRGVIVGTTLTNDCGNKGDVFRTPFTATRTGNVPPGVVIADPALFIPAP